MTVILAYGFDKNSIQDWR